MNEWLRRTLQSSRIPANLDRVTEIDDELETEPARVGAEPRAVEAVWERVQALYRTGTHPGIQITLRHRGEVLLQRALGHSQGNGPHDRPDGPKVPMTTETPVCYFSASKAVTALLIHILAEDGLINLLEPVSYYCPEFARNGKKHITIHQILSHRGGIPGLPSDTPIEALWDEQRIWNLLCDARPIQADDSKVAYHAITGGYVLGELVRRVTGESIDTLLDRRLRQPMEMRYFTYGINHDQLLDLAWNYATGPKLVFPMSWIVRRALGGDIDTVAEVSNDPRFQEAVIPAGNLCGTSEEMGRFFQMMLNGGTWNGRRICAESTVVGAIQASGSMQLDRTMMVPMRFSAGFMLGADPVGLWGQHSSEAFGHVGLINKWCWADPARDISVSLINTGIPIVGHHLPALAGFVHQVCRSFPVLSETQRPLGNRQAASVI
ncbi:CubicO group peptidase (beta-lactamase class C family) [Halospina denitrificans]|uniref:CubicO group peptidase (Beta-lactamase class C family) n=1 Tax=Halospina denitrificans TaxID=332522 RepID=A0A4V3ER07_9GAMM|nr:serine hydrolase domain-containing protein [Halospina denitrificans]TDT44118.1 CubicO group peptidase (beta-lactamase class C family) [Halospina denitrificans]